MTLDQINSYSVEYRGIVLNEITKLEKVMDVYLCQYFSSDEEKQDELLLLVFGGLRITFENKRGILDYLQKTGKIDIQTDYRSMLSDMQDLFSDRKVLAHYMLDMSPEALNLDDGTIRFYALNNKFDKKIFTAEHMSMLEFKLDKMIRIFTKLVSANPL